MPDQKTIKSPLPGTFYRRPSPDAHPYVKEGDIVQPGDVVGLVEAMKSYYEIVSEESGVVDRFLVENEGPVDAAQDVVAFRPSVT